jgi:hypothetical protein
MILQRLATITDQLQLALHLAAALVLAVMPGPGIS